jgi:LacI family transcriptional regulator
MSGRGYVSAEVRTQVQEAAQRLGYVPDGIARSLRARTTHVIGVVISDIGNPFYAEVANGVEAELRTRGYQMLLADSDGRPDDERAALQTFQSMRMAGLIITPAVPSSDAVEQLVRAGMPVIEVDRVTTDGRCDAVLVENERGAYQATRHLVELGHQRIGAIVGEVSYTTGAGRLDGYRAALQEAGLPVDDAIVRHTSFHPPDARVIAGELLEAHPEVTAVFATNNVLAQGALRAIRETGRRVPRDISLVGFDDAPWMEFAEPGITTVSQPTAELGREAASLLVDRLAGDLTGRPVVRRLPTRLVRRGSAGPPRRGA